MNPGEQKAHRVVTTEIALNLQALTDAWRDEFSAACERLDFHMRQIEENRRECVDLRLELSRVTDLVGRLSRATGDVVEPLRRRTLWGRVRWIWEGVTPRETKRVAETV